MSGRILPGPGRGTGREGGAGEGQLELGGRSLRLDTPAGSVTVLEQGEYLVLEVEASGAWEISECSSDEGGEHALVMVRRRDSARRS